MKVAVSSSCLQADVPEKKDLFGSGLESLYKKSRTIGLALELCGFGVGFQAPQALHTSPSRFSKIELILREEFGSPKAIIVNK